MKNPQRNNNEGKNKPSKKSVPSGNRTKNSPDAAPSTARKLYKGRDKAQKPVYEWVDEAPAKRPSTTKKPFSGIKKESPDKTSLNRPDYDLKRTGSSPNDDEVRLNKYIANAGICSRRDADKLIESGEISVNGAVITSLGYKVRRTDKVTYKDKKLNPERPVYLLLNKPKDFITTTDDPFERKTVMQLISNACSERVFPIGRLDRNTTGLLLFTNDGELSERLAHPSNQIKKIYQVSLDKPLAKKDLEIILEGVELEDGLTKVDDLQILSKDKTILGMEIHSGKNRIVRRIFAHFGYEVIALDRVMYAGLTKKDLPRGNYRFLSESEVINLKYLGKSKKRS
ncbi:Ribosomal large subunit pseudouridine synthase B [Lunatimonas lonarensis]|uniref:Pseudouridine synthase n=1 Tax=Lunatimonas lonarensis TaxID=1232681 RepID=R7ZWB2_9BACT|nr:pseudouridine synthase [Lunatimonas lonarensis]EON78435.1 Ribosomal large subunit pseudouridine synthase B [Lunatimonas lonarensis]